MEEDLDRTDALVALTNMDEENVIISMFATLHEVGKVIAKINHISLDKILEKSGVDCTVTPHLILLIRLCNMSARCRIRAAMA